MVKEIPLAAFIIGVDIENSSQEHQKPQEIKPFILTSICSWSPFFTELNDFF